MSFVVRLPNLGSSVPLSFTGLAAGADRRILSGSIGDPRRMVAFGIAGWVSIKRCGRFRSVRTADPTGFGQVVTRVGAAVRALVIKPAASPSKPVGYALRTLQINTLP